MRIAIALSILLLASTISGQPPYPQEFEVRRCATIDGRDPACPDVARKNCMWIRTDDGWMVSGQ